MLNDPTEQEEDNFNVEQVQGSLRDKLMAVSQGFLSRARNVHRPEDDEGSRPSSGAQYIGVFILPPTPVLETFLRTYASRVERYLPFFPASNISATSLLTSNDETSSILLLLLMIAHGAMASALPEARRFASGLMEVCRISVFDLMERNVQLATHPIMLRCVLLYLHAGAWSGTKWHMNVSWLS